MGKGFYVKVDPYNNWKAINGFFVKTSQTAWKSVADAWIKVSPTSWMPFYSAATSPDTPVEILTSYNTSEELMLQGKNYHWTSTPTTLQYKFTLVNKGTGATTDITSYTNTTNPSSGNSITLPSSSTYQTITVAGGYYYQGATNVYQFNVKGTTSTGATFTTKAEYEMRVPAAPTISVTDLTGTSVKLTITAASTEDFNATYRYIVYRYDSVDGTVYGVSGGTNGLGGYGASTNPVEVTLTGLVSGRQYYFYVMPITGSSGYNTTNYSGYPGSTASIFHEMPIGPGNLSSVTAYSFTAGKAQGFFTTGTNTTSVKYNFTCSTIPSIFSPVKTLNTSSSLPYQIEENLLSLFSYSAWQNDTYNAGIYYYYGDTVWYAGNLYQAKYVGSNTGFYGKGPTDTNYWTYITSNWYYPGNYVYYNNTYYFCKSATAGTYPTNTTYWTPVLSWSMTATPYNSTLAGNSSSSDRTILIYVNSYGDPLRISSGPTVSNQKSDSVDLTFLPSIYTTNAIVHMKLNSSDISGYPKNVTVTGATEKVYTASGLTALTTYAASIQARYVYNDTYGVYFDGETTADVTATTAANLKAPTSFTASSDKNDKITLTWAGGAGAGYQVYWTTGNAYRPTDQQAYSDFDAGTASPFDWTAMTRGTTYYFYIRAYNGTTYSNWYPASAPGSSGKAKLYAPPAFTITNSAAASDSLSWYWDSPTAATGEDSPTSWDYALTQSTTTPTSWTNITTRPTSTSPLVTSSLTASTTYYLHVKAKNADSSTSNYKSAATSAAATLYTVTFNVNGASGSPSVSSVKQSSEGGSVTLASIGTMSKTGNIFGGWRTSTTSGTVYAFGATYTPTSNVTLYAYYDTTPTCAAPSWGAGYFTRANASSELIWYTDYPTPSGGWSSITSMQFQIDTGSTGAGIRLADSTRTYPGSATWPYSGGGTIWGFKCGKDRSTVTTNRVDDIAFSTSPRYARARVVFKGIDGSTYNGSWTGWY